MEDQSNKYISVLEILMGRIKPEELSTELTINVNTLVTKVNSLLELFYKENPTEPKKMVSSGYRSPAINATIPGAAKKSNHMKCAAVDLEDKNRKLSNWCVKNINKLKDLELYMESPKHATTWVHLQIVKTKSGNTIFIP